MAVSENVKQLFSKAPKEIQDIVFKVLELEREKLSQERPRLKSDIQDLIKGVVVNDED